MTHIKALKLARDCIRDSVEYKQGKATAIEAVEDIDEALAQPQQEPVLKQSWKMVPVEPTKEMLDAADDGDDSYTLRNFGPGVNRVMQGPEDHYAAMLAAAPQPPQRKPLSLDELEALWNSQADYMNQWDELGLDEIVVFAQAAHGIKE